LNLFLLYYKTEELAPILKEKAENDKIWLLEARKYHKVLEKYSLPSKTLRSWYIIQKILRMMHSVDVTMMDVNSYYPYTNLHQIIFPNTPLIWRIGGNPFIENAKRIGHLFPPNPEYKPGGRFYLSLSKMMLDRCSAIISHSNWLKKVLQKDLAHKKIFVIYQNVDINRFNPTIDGLSFRNSLGIKKDQIVLLSVMGGAYFEKIQGVFIYLKVIKRLNIKFGNKVVVLFCGRGRYYPYLHEYASKLKIDNIHFLGFRDDLNRIYAASDIFVHPSSLDAAPRVIREAGISGKPIVAFNIGGIPELIDSKNSFLINPPYSDNLYSVIVNLIENKDLREEYGKRAFIDILVKNKISSGKLFWRIFKKFSK